MQTYVDFITHVKGVEYILSVLTIAGFIVFLEILKPRPFGTVLETTKDDLAYMKEAGTASTLRTVKRMLAAPFIGLAYVIALPFVFTYALAMELLRMASDGLERLFGLAGKTVFFGWRPMEAYFGGKKGRKEKERKEQAKDDDKEEETE